jgi:glucosamine--fructose-6-phosphate aminotransferase (isomerizing)
LKIKDSKMNPYIQDILAQPEALAATLRQLPQAVADLRSLGARLETQVFSRIVLTGMGSSLAALYPLWFRLVQAGYAPVIIETSELLYDAANLITDDTLLVIVSQSGRSAEIVRLIEQRQGATVLAITNDATSPLAQAAEVVVLTAAGTESNVSCKTYVCSLAALALVSDTLVAQNPVEPPRLEQLQGASEIMAAYLNHWQEYTPSLGDLLSGSSLIICGRGPSLASVHYSALILKEAAKVHTEGLSAPQFRHGPMELAKTSVRVLVYEGQGSTVTLNRRLVADVTGVGGRAYLIGNTDQPEAFHLPAAPPAALPILEILPMQLLSVGLAWHNQLEPGQFYIGSKITTVE